MSTTDMLRAQLENKTGVVGATIVLQSGKYFDFLEPTPEMFDPTDIAWGLSNICRFGGQSLQFYSVAQHCVLVSANVPRQDALAALLHDGAEAYTGDMVGPLKQLCPDFKVVEKRVEAAMAARFGLSLPWAPSIKHADLRLLRTEQRDLTAAPGDSWNGLDAYIPLEFKINPWGQQEAALFWMSEFRRLGGVA